MHGLPGGREATWTSTAARTTFWLKDVLPAYLPHARVWSFGYEVGGEGFSAAEIEKIAVELLDALRDEKMVETVSFAWLWGVMVAGC